MAGRQKSVAAAYKVKITPRLCTLEAWVLIMIGRSLGAQAAYRMRALEGLKWVVSFNLSCE